MLNHAQFEGLAEAGIDTSVGSVGDCCDNALAESIIALNRKNGRFAGHDAGAETLAVIASAHAHTTGLIGIERAVAVWCHLRTSKLL